MMDHLSIQPASQPANQYLGPRDKPDPICALKELAVLPGSQECTHVYYEVIYLKSWALPAWSLSVFFIDVAVWTECSHLAIVLFLFIAPGYSLKPFDPRKTAGSCGYIEIWGEGACTVSWVQCHSKVLFSCTGNWAALAQASGASRTFASILTHPNQLF